MINGPMTGRNEQTYRLIDVKFELLEQIPPSFLRASRILARDVISDLIDKILIVVYKIPPS